MPYIYVTEQGASIKRRGRRLLVEKDGKKLADIQASKVEGVLIFGNVQFTTQAVRLMLEEDVEMAMFSGRGKLLGQIVSPSTKNITLRQAQYEKFAGDNFALSFSTMIVDAKLSNCIAFMKLYAHNHPELDIGDRIFSMERLKAGLPSKTDDKGLRGVEGIAATAYFQAFGEMVQNRFPFPGRKKRPSTDPVNALLSLGYTMVYNEISWLLDGMGFDPYLGYYHKPHYGHATLASDLMEEFRAPLVDRFTLSLVNNRVFLEDDFFLHKPSGGMHLKKEPSKRYFAHYEKFLTRDNVIEDGSTLSSYRKLFLRQAERLKKAIADDVPYVPYKFRRL